MGKSAKKAASKVDAAAVVAAPTKPLKKGKREADGAIAKEVVSAKKQRVEEKKIPVKPQKNVVKKKVESSSEDDSSSDSEELPKVKAPSAKNGHVKSDPKKIPANGAKNGHAVRKKKVESSDNSGSDEDVPATKKAPAAAAEKKKESSDDSDSGSESEDEAKKAPANPPKKGPAAAAQKESSSNESDSGDESSSDEDVASAKKAPAVPSKGDPKTAAKKEEESSSDESDSEEDSDDGVAAAKKAPAAPSKNDAVTKKKDESSSDDEGSDEDVAAKSEPKPVMKKTDESSEESESDDESSSEGEDGDVKMVDAAKTKSNAGKGASPFEKTPKSPATPKGQPTGSKTLFVGNLSYSIERSDVENFFQSAGEVVDVRFSMTADNEFKGFGHVEFATSEAAEKALKELNGQDLLGRAVRLDLARERGSYTPYSGGKDTQSFQKGGRGQAQTVFVRGFDINNGEDQIRSSLEEHFGSCGEISRVSIPQDPEGGFKGIAYINFTSPDALNQALKLNGSELGDGNSLYVDEAKPRVDDRDSGHGGFRGSSRGGRKGGRDSGDRFSGRGGRGSGRGRGDGGRFGRGGRGR